MHVIGVALLVAATATGGIGKPHVPKRLFLRGHAVVDGPAPPGGPIGGAMGGPGFGACPFGHPGCQGGPSCPGAVEGAGADGMAGAQSGRRFPNVRSQVFFADPPGMKIGWQSTVGNGERVYLPGQLTVPARYNFRQGYIYRLKLTDIADRPGLVLYPTIEVAPSTPATDAYLTHNPIPAQFTPEDFDQVVAGNFVTKVIYLPDPKYQELAIAGVETLVSTRLEPGVDPILEADRRGTILMIMRVGAIDLEMPNAGTSAPGFSTTAPGTVLPPNSLPRNPASPPPTVMEGVPVDHAPVSPAPAVTTPPPVPEPPVEPAAPEATPAVEPGVEPAPAVDPVPPPAEDMPLEEEPAEEEPQLQLEGL
jgi:hypothetical protein